MTPQPGEALREALTELHKVAVLNDWRQERHTARCEPADCYVMRALAAPVAGEGLDVESGMTPEARAKYRAALAANQPVAEERT